MLRNCILPTSYEQTRNSKRCGEIICYDDVSFTINCVLCKIKLFEFEEFMLHYQNVHLRGSDNDYDKSLDDKLEVCIKNERHDNLEHITEFNEWGGIIAENDEQPVRILGGLIKSKQSSVPAKASTKEAADSGSEYEQHDTSAETNPYTDVLWHEQEDDDADDVDLKGDGEWKPNGDEDEDNHILKKPRKSKTYQCEQCHKLYTTQRILKTHIRMKHLQPRDFKCEQCGEEYAKKSSLDSHMRNKHIGFPCTQCDRTYKKAYSLRVHMQEEHSAVKEHICDYENCGKAFASLTLFKIHRKRHTDDRNIVCEVCGFRTGKLKELTVHKRTHTGERPYECTICGRRFMSSSLLNEHKAMHSTERPHKCDVCGAAFARPKALYHHKFLHLGVKKFVCKLCGRAYAQMAGLAGHMRQHRAEEPSF